MRGSPRHKLAPLPPLLKQAALLTITLLIGWRMMAFGGNSRSGSDESESRAPVSPTQGAGGTDGRSKPATEPDLGPLLETLGEKAAVYESVALRFVCVETTRSSEDSYDEKKYDYMYVEVEAQRYKPYRQRHTNRSSQNASEVEVETDFPDSFSWTMIFSPARQHLFHFKYVGQEWFSLRRAYIIEFTAPLPFTTGKTIYEWSGKVWVDAENYNFLKIEATPTNQEERLRQLLSAYRQAPRFLVFPMAHRPSGARYEITFLNDYQKLSLPDQAEYREFTLDLEGNAELTGFQTHRYSQYQFFGVQVQDRFLK